MINYLFLVENGNYVGRQVSTGLEVWQYDGNMYVASPFDSAVWEIGDRTLAEFFEVDYEDSISV